ncbi:hypothetical protein Efla_003708 [Eimeria flavescens]
MAACNKLKSFANHTSAALSLLQEVYRLHGDWLYSKNMLDKAVDMYIKTIGFLEPSAVIQKFLDCQELSHLALYLLHLHIAGCAMQQHTLLFFKCTARLRDDSLLSCFLEDPRISKTCSLSVALNECRLNGDTKLACTIASRHGYHDEYLSLLLETKEFAKAVELLKQVDAPAACSLLLKHGSALLKHSAIDVLLLLSQFIKDYHTSVEIFIPLFVDDPDLLLLFLSLLTHGASTASRLVPQYEGLCGDARLQEAIEKAQEAISMDPSIFGCSPFSSLLELLLRAQRKWCAYNHARSRVTSGLNGSNAKEPTSVGSEGQDRTSDVPSIYAEVLLKTLKSRQMTHEDQYRSTLLCTIFGFEEGMVLVGEKRQELQLPVAYFEANNDIPNLLRFCLKNGSKDPTLWTQTLNILASQSGTQRQIREVLIHIERHQLLPPLAVLELLQQSQAVTLDAVKEYFLRASDDLADELAHSHELLQSDRAEVSQMTEEVRQFKTKGRESSLTPAQFCWRFWCPAESKTSALLGVSAQVFESERCDFCFLPVELPSIHFRCGHSFHIYCLSSNTEDKAGGGSQAPDMSPMSYCCAICTPQFNAKRVTANTSWGPLVLHNCVELCNFSYSEKRVVVGRTFMQLLLSQREAEACNTDDFFKYLRGSTNGFDYILSCFGRGLFPSPLVRGGVMSFKRLEFASSDYSRGHFFKLSMIVGGERAQHFEAFVLRICIIYQKTIGLLTKDVVGLDSLDLGQVCMVNEKSDQTSSGSMMQTPQNHAGPLSWDLNALDWLSGDLRQPAIPQQSLR